MALGCLDQKIINAARAAEDIVGGVCRESEHENDDENDHSMSIVRQKSCLNGQLAVSPGYPGCLSQTLIPPNMVYNTTPTGSRKQAAAVGTPVRAVTTAEPPVRSIAVTRILVIRPKTMKTMWVTAP
ncbi:hypothetical protein MPH_04342 [Macrophomina phaseolina MS6]|uniref:Uncharacterized protein n=1 Tax=Macrophomina phaseolina (strain MS6) TaxID=1126212 RepID=K2SP80_MACPH|nr:hypothetical protein MPH_04342 [Macrophomina phaseolina MS6]